MGLQYQDLVAQTRDLMLAEITDDVDARGLYISSYLSPSGEANYPQQLRDAAANGTDNSLASSLKASRAFKATYDRKHPKRMGFVQAKVPHTAPQTLAESQFNMYFIRAVCLRAIDEGREIEVYRARHSDNPRPESERLIGTRPDPEMVLTALRETKGVNPPNGIPMPNSGLSVKLV
jgi:hypothetical protein